MEDSLEDNLSPPQQTSGRTKTIAFSNKEIGIRYKNFKNTFAQFLKDTGNPNLASLSEFMLDYKITGDGHGLYVSSDPTVVKKIGIYLKFQEGQQILDLGSGRGMVAILLAALFKTRVTGIEWDEELWEFSEKWRRYAEKAGLIKIGDVKFLKGNFLDDRYSWREYDFIYYYRNGYVSFTSIAKKLKEQLKKGGVLIYRVLGWGPLFKNKELSLLTKIGFDVKKNFFVPITMVLVKQPMERGSFQSDFRDLQRAL